MRAVRVHEFGIADLVVEDVDDPEAGNGEILIAAEAATINPVDVALVSGALAPSLPPAFSAPYTPGWDVAGRVLAVGEGVDPGLVGQRVLGFSLWFAGAHGTQSSRVVLPLENVAVAPDGLSSSQLTTVGLNGLTAWRAVDELDPQPGETVVVTGAAGSVGGFALELAVARGARVIAAVSERDREQVLAAGAADVAPREEGDLPSVLRRTVPDGVDGLIDTASVGRAAIGAVRDGGRFITTTDAPAEERGIRVAGIHGVPDAAALAELVERASTGRLRTPVAREFALEDARAAYTEFASGPHRGRIVLVNG